MGVFTYAPRWPATARRQAYAAIIFPGIGLTPRRGAGYQGLTPDAS